MIQYNQLPPEFKSEVVKKYYDHLVKKRGQLVAKRCFDLIFSIVLLLLLSPLFLILSIWIKLDSKGPVFYRQERLTQYGKRFKIFKFRTMVADADKVGGLVTLGNDSRITKVGQFIRDYRLDEIPQLINVLLGDMSFVGVRPEVEKYTSEYTTEMKATLLLPAGITSPASIVYKDEAEVISEWMVRGLSSDQAYLEKVLPEKMIYNLKYLEEFSFFNDLKIMVQTAVKVFK